MTVRRLRTECHRGEVKELLFETLPRLVLWARLDWFHRGPYGALTLLASLIGWKGPAERAPVAGTRPPKVGSMGWTTKSFSLRRRR